MTNNYIHHAMRAALWEEAKGKLRALIAVAGSVPSTSESSWQELEVKINKFIADVELDELHIAGSL